MRYCKYMLFSFVCIFCILICGCQGDDQPQSTDTATDTSGSSYAVSSDLPEAPSLIIDTVTLPIYSYGTYDTLGEADVTLVYSAEICDGTADSISESAHLRSAMMIRCDEAVFEDSIVTDEDEIFNWFYSGYARLYGIKNKTVYTKDDGYHYETVRYHHGMDGEALNAYGEEANERFISRREYMYLIRIADNTWLCLDFYVPDHAPEVEMESEYYDKVAARVEVPRIEYAHDAYGEYLLRCMEDNLHNTEYHVRTPDMQLTYTPDSENHTEYPDIMALDAWTLAPAAEYTADRDRFTLFLGTDHIGDYSICATDTDNIMAVLSPDAPVLFYRLPDGVADGMIDIPAREAERRRAEYEARVDSMKSFLPDGAVRLTHIRQIFCMSDFLLAYESTDEELCIWRAEDLGERYEKLEIVIPEEYEYDRAEIVYISDGGGSGEYYILIRLYNGDSARVLEFVGAGRGECLFNYELTEADLEVRTW